MGPQDRRLAAESAGPAEHFGSDQTLGRARAEKGEVMPIGKLKMWNAAHGFGFIQNDAGGPDMYLHASALKEANIDPDALKIGDPLTYEIGRASCRERV